MKALRILGVLLLSALPVFSADVYFASVNTGASNGTSCANAFAYNDATNGMFTAGKDVAGNILHICGTINVASGARFGTLAGGGAVGNPLTIKWETNAIVQSPHFASGGISMDGQSNVVLDGGTNGILQNTLNGTVAGNGSASSAACPAGPCTSHSNGWLISAHPCTNCEIKNLSAINSYVRLYPSTDTGVDQSTVGAIFYGGTGNKFHDNLFQDGGWLINFNAVSSNVQNQIYNNRFGRMDHGIVCGGKSGDTSSSLVVNNNHFYDMMVWDQSGGHHDGIHCFSGTGSNDKLQNIYISNNLFDGNPGALAQGLTGWIYLEQNDGNAWTDATGTAFMWNNVVITQTQVAQGIVYIGRGANHVIYNNTVYQPVGPSGNGGQSACFTINGTNVTIKNNVSAGCEQVLNFLGTGNTIAAMSNNLYANYYIGGNPGGNAPYNWPGHGQANSLAAWKTLCSCDANSIDSPNVIAGLSNAGVPSAGFLGIGSGVNLTSAAVGNLVSLASDTSAGGAHVPVARPSSGVWDIGAYQFVSGPPNPPSGLGATVN